MCDYCNRADGGHFRGCPNEPDEDERPMPFEPLPEDIARDEMLFNWDDERWNK
jgi:hypothetical protein